MSSVFQLQSSQANRWQHTAFTPNNLQFGRAGQFSKRQPPQDLLEKAEPQLSISTLPEQTMPELQQALLSIEEDWQQFDTSHPVAGHWFNNPLGYLKRFAQRQQHQLQALAVHWQMLQVLRNGVQLYLPDISKKRIDQYVFSPSIVKDFFNPHAGPATIISKLISYTGPPMTKFFQTEAQKAENDSIESLKSKLKTAQEELQKAEDDHLYACEKERNELKARKGQPLSEEEQDEADAIRTQRLNNINLAKKTVKELNLLITLKPALKPLLNKVPPVPFKDIKGDFEATLKAYNEQYPHDPIDGQHIDKKPIGAGSMAQVYRGKTRSGKDIIVKVFRPEASPEYMTSYRRFVEYMFLFLLGNNQKADAEQYAKTMMDVFTEEVSTTREQRYAKAILEQAQRMNVSIAVPQVLATSPRGFVEEAVEGTDLANITNPAERAKALQVLAPFLIKSFLLEPARYLDPQGGNFKWNEKTQQAAIFDYGRMALLDAQSNQSTYKAFLRRACENLLYEQHSGWASFSYERQGLPKPTLPLTRETAIFGFGDKKVPYQVQKKRLNDYLFKPIFDTTRWQQRQADSREKARVCEQIWGGYKKPNNPEQHVGLFNKDSEQSAGNNEPYNLFAILENWAKAADDGWTKPLTSGTDKVTMNDVTHGREKLRALVKPYFTHAQGNYSDEALQKELSAASYQDIYRLFLIDPNHPKHIKSNDYGTWYYYNNRKLDYNLRNNISELVTLDTDIQSKNHDIKKYQKDIDAFEKGLRKQKGLKEDDKTSIADSDLNEYDLNSRKKHHKELHKLNKELHALKKDREQTLKDFKQILATVLSNEDQQYNSSLESLLTLKRVHKHLTTLATELVNSLYAPHELDRFRRQVLTDAMVNQLILEYDPLTKA